MPQLPTTTLVTPWLVLFAMSPISSARSSWVCTSMKPGASARPRASTVSRALQFRRSPITRILSPVTARSPTIGGPPAPSNRVARWIRRSQLFGSVTARSLVRHQDDKDLLHVDLAAPAERSAPGHEDGLGRLERLAAGSAIVQLHLALQEMHQLVAAERRRLAVIGRRRPQPDGELPAGVAIDNMLGAAGLNAVQQCRIGPGARCERGAKIQLDDMVGRRLGRHRCRGVPVDHENLAHIAVLLPRAVKPARNDERFAGLDPRHAAIG